MFVVGGEAALDNKGRRLLQSTYGQYYSHCSPRAMTSSNVCSRFAHTDCWVQALNFVKPGNDYKDIGAIIEDHVVEQGFTTVKSFCGHGYVPDELNPRLRHIFSQPFLRSVGSVFHTNPNIVSVPSGSNLMENSC